MCDELLVGLVLNHHLWETFQPFSTILEELRRKDKRQKKYPKLPVVSARDGTEADAAKATPPAERYLSGRIAIWVQAKISQK